MINSNELCMEHTKSIDYLHESIINNDNADDALWQTVIAYQNYPFYTSSGLPFSYTVKCKKNGDFSGELIISRKEESKTLTKSSVIHFTPTVLNAVCR